MPELGQIDSAERDETAHFRLSGEFDLSNAWMLHEALLAAVREGVQAVVVDLSEVRFMDGQTVRALVKARSAAARRGLRFEIVPPRDEVVSRVADLVDFDLAA